jgi:cobalt-zinc-cadmium efflux system outer membrane protein
MLVTRGMRGTGAALLLGCGVIAGSGNAAPTEPALKRGAWSEESSRTRDLSLEDALAAALVRHPRLAGAAATVEVARGELREAATRPNPEIGIDLEGFAGTGEVSGFGSSEASLTVTQIVELGGKRDRRVAVSEQTAAVATAEFERIRDWVRWQTHAAFVRVLAAQERWLLAQERTALAGQEADAIARRVRAGATPQAEAERAGLEVEWARIEERSMVGRLEAGRLELAASWGSTDTDFGRAVGSLATPPRNLVLDELLLAVEQSPRLRSADAAVATARARFELAKRGRIPDVAVAFGVRRYGGSRDLGLIAGVSLPLPIWNRGTGRVAAEFAGIELREAALAASSLELRSRLTVLHSNMELARQRAAELQAEALPRAARAHQEVVEAHRRGAMRFTDVLDARRRLFAAREKLVDAEEEAWLLWTEIESIVGSSVLTEEKETKRGVQ